jgi:hypothetical protein
MTWVGERESLRGPKAQESNRPCPELIPWGAIEWVRLSSWDQAAEAPVQGLKGFCKKVQERKG